MLVNHSFWSHQCFFGESSWKGDETCHSISSSRFLIFCDNDNWCPCYLLKLNNLWGKMLKWNEISIASYCEQILFSSFQFISFSSSLGCVILMNKRLSWTLTGFSHEYIHYCSTVYLLACQIVTNNYSLQSDYFGMPKCFLNVAATPAVKLPASLRYCEIMQFLDLFLTSWCNLSCNPRQVWWVCLVTFGLFPFFHVG